MTPTNKRNSALREDGSIYWIEQARLARTNPDYERVTAYVRPTARLVSTDAARGIGPGRGYVGWGEADCAVCDRGVVANHPGIKYCSERCRNDAYMERRRVRRAAAREKTCEVCSESFTAKRSDAKTCSAACKQKAYRQRSKEAP
jgi:predicted nucleic acid-binding Zn ribbon protein